MPIEFIGIPEEIHQHLLLRQVESAMVQSTKYRVSRLAVATIRPYSSSASQGTLSSRVPSSSTALRLNLSLVDVVESVGEPRGIPRERTQLLPTTELRELRDLPSPDLHFPVPLDRSPAAAQPRLTAT